MGEDNILNNIGENNSLRDDEGESKKSQHEESNLEENVHENHSNGSDNQDGSNNNDNRDGSNDNNEDLLMTTDTLPRSPLILSADEELLNDASEINEVPPKVPEDSEKQIIPGDELNTAENDKEDTSKLKP